MSIVKAFTTSELQCKIFIDNINYVNNDGHDILFTTSCVLSKHITKCRLNEN